jgi:hypothetical protein
LVSAAFAKRTSSFNTNSPALIVPQ